MIIVNIKFKNGSEINCLHYDKETKRGAIRGRRLSNKEYNRTTDREIVNAENRVSELLERLYDNNSYIRKPSEFYEQIFGIKLLGYQKKLLDIQFKGQLFIQTRSPHKKFGTYLRLLLTYVNMEEGGTRAAAYKSCFDEKLDSCDEYRPIFWYRNETKEKCFTHYGICNSKCYSKYGLKRTGCAGCPFGRDFEFELQVIKKYEPKLYVVVNNIFGESYEYTRKYREFSKDMGRRG